MTIATDKIIEKMQESPTTSAWESATWDEFLLRLQQPPHQKAKAYYFRGAYQLIMGVGASHATVNLIISLLVELYCIVRGISFHGLTNASYRKEGVRECQPDSSFYFGDAVTAVPTGSTIANLDQYAPPNLVIEIADSSLADDLGMKRLLYEEMQVQEYWVVDVQKLEIFAFMIDDNLGSRRICESIVLPGLSMDAIADALHQSQGVDHAQLGQWWMAKIKP